MYMYFILKIPTNMEYFPEPLTSAIVHVSQQRTINRLLIDLVKPFFSVHFQNKCSFTNQFMGQKLLVRNNMKVH